MNVALIGSGGREHAIALSISKSKILKELFIIPGNPGTKTLGSNVTLDINNHQEIISFCYQNNIDLVIVGPEKPLIDGIADSLIESGIKVFGPTKKAARIEGEKSFAKELMHKHNIPTAAYKIFYKEDFKKTVDYFKTVSYPIVIKADGIAAGKGVVIAQDYDSAVGAVNDCFNKNIFGEAGSKIVVEEFLTGQEVSVFAVTDGKDLILFPPAQDHKRIGEGDTGKNTGGMGAYAPTPFVDDLLMKKISDTIVTPTLNALREEKSIYVGCLYCGLIITEEGPKVIEFNCRFGDPETQVVLPLLDGDIIELFLSAADGKLNKESVWYNGGSSVCVVIASIGYPDKYEKGKIITGIEKIMDERILVFHAGTNEKDNLLLTNGGRVLSVTSVIKENNLSYAKELVYKEIKKINFDGMYYRRDISDKAFINK